MLPVQTGGPELSSYDSPSAREVRGRRSGVYVVGELTGQAASYLASSRPMKKPHLQTNMYTQAPTQTQTSR